MGRAYFMPCCCDHYRLVVKKKNTYEQILFDVYCSLESGHEGPHMAYWKHDPKRPAATWEDPGDVIHALLDLYKDLA